MQQNILEMGLAFLEGLALIASPCIWPILPLVLSTSLSGGRARPFGVIAGFVFSFAAFAWASRWLITALNIDLDYVKYGSLTLLGLFGIVLLSTKLSEKFAALVNPLANIGARLSDDGRGGFGGGVAVGALIGLVWTPCAGPVLAAVLVHIIRQSNDLYSLLILFSFAVGVAVPMSVIALTGRAAVTRFGFVRSKANALRKTIGAVILASALYLASGIDLPTLIQQSSLFQQTFSETTIEGGGSMQTPTTTSKISATEPVRLIKGLARPYPAPPLKLGGEWINSAPLTMDGLRGKVVLIDFWTYSCINCLRTLPYITQWDQKYRDKGLVIIGVHAPEFEFEKDAGNVRQAIERYNIRYPVMQDNNLDTWTLFKNHYWPAHYLIDRQGNVVYTHFGEGEYDVTEKNIQSLLGASEDIVRPAAGEASGVLGQTPETYLGWLRAESMANQNGFSKGAATDFALPVELRMNDWALGGKWIVDKERVVSADAGGVLKLNFQSRKVFLVLGSPDGKPVTATLTLDGNALGTRAGRDVTDGVVTVNQNRLYELVDMGRFQSGMLEIRADAPGLEAYAFTFGE